MVKVEKNKLVMFALGCIKHLTGCALPWLTPFYKASFAPLGVEVLMQNDFIWPAQANNYHLYRTKHAQTKKASLLMPSKILSTN